MNSIALPPSYLLLRQPRRVCEVVLVEPGSETILFAGKRWPAKSALHALRLDPKYAVLPAFCRKITGNLVELPAGASARAQRKDK